MDGSPGQERATLGNPLLQPSALPCGLPDFAAITPEHIRSALVHGMAEEKRQWQEIANNPEPPSAENTVAAVDAAGAVLDRADAVFETLLWSTGGDVLNQLAEEMAPSTSAHRDDFWMNRQMFERYRAVARLQNLDEETRWLVSQTLGGFRRGGVDLPAREQDMLRDLNSRIATLETQVDARISRQLESVATTGGDPAELAGLSDEDIEAAQQAARQASVTGGNEATPVPAHADADAAVTNAGSRDLATGAGMGWRLPVSNSSQPPMIAFLDDHGVRKRALADSVTRGFGSDPDVDTRRMILELADARARRANLLGFPDHAALVMDDQTVPDPAAATALLKAVGRAAVRRVEEERPQHEQAARDAGHLLGPEDWLYFENKQRGQQLGIELGELRNYLELDSVLHNGLFFAANRLYGLTFRPRPDLRGWTDDVRVWEVHDEDDRSRGLFLADYYTHPGKGGGAWMGQLQAACGRSGELPIVTNDANFTKPPEGQPTLLTWDEVETCFHEFGHALHGLLSATHYAATSGTDVPADFVELPSQLNEMWAYNPMVLANFARHHETGEALPAAVAAKIASSKHFGQGFATLEYVQAALIDQYWHASDAQRPSDAADVEAFEANALAHAEVDHPLVIPRYRTPYFAHTFGGGYDGSYYSYMWAEAMVGELEEWFAEQAQPRTFPAGEAEAGEETDSRVLSQGGSQGGPGSDGGLNRRAGRILQTELLSRGNSRDPLQSFVAVKGREPEGSAVIRRRGLS